jgi:hypothetical protein
VDDVRREDWIVREEFRVVRVSSLPYAHNPSRCTHAALFTDARQEGSGRRFFDGLSEEQLAACRYHQLADWFLVARTSVHFFREYRERLQSDLHEAVLKAQLSSADLEQLYGLFVDPIVWGGKSDSVTNGQHRICAIRASGARLCVIDHNRFSPYDPAPPPS